MRLIVLLSLLASATVAAETAYVTDQLRLGIHLAPDTSDRPFRMLESGQEMEIQQRSGNYAFVRLPDGTEGYVKKISIHSTNRITEHPVGNLPRNQL